jgi:hypothetical protein
MKETEYSLAWWRRIHRTATEMKAVNPELTLEMILNDIQNYIEFLQRKQAN